MNQIHVLLSIHMICKDMHQIHVLSIHNVHVLLRQIHVLLSIHNTHVLLRHESDTCITVYT